MECNKDEAKRAKELAEKKLREKDIAGAKRFASKAQSLFPGLEGLAEFQETLDVYIAFERKVNGEVDWYGILGVDPLADDDTIRKRYRKLALSLHPDKNKSTGADGAFKILSEAWSFLSDKAKRAAYNKKQNIRASNKKLRGENPPAGARKNSSKNVTNNVPSTRNPPAPDAPRNDSASHRSNLNTFWTSCKRCDMQYEYLIIYRNQNLLCPNCRKPFLAVEVPAPHAKVYKPSGRWPIHQQQQGANRAFNNLSSGSGRQFPPSQNMNTSGHSGIGSMSRENVPQGLPTKSGGARSVPTSAEEPGRPAHSFQSMGKNLKRGREEAVAGAVDETLHMRSASKRSDAGLASENGSCSGKEERPAKRKRVKEHKANVGGKGMLKKMPPGGGVSGQANTSGSEMRGSERQKVFVSESIKPKSARDMSPSETRYMLVEKAKMEILKELTESNRDASSKSSAKDGKNVEKKSRFVNAAQESIASGMKKEGNMNVALEDADLSVQQKKSLSPMATQTDSKTIDTVSNSVPDPNELKKPSLSAATTDSGANISEIMTMSVPDPEFFDFDKDRTEESFGNNQVWALYDDEDGMPRFYAFLHGVISKEPFKVSISWLNSKSNSKLGPLNWVDYGFSKTCGVFRIGKHLVNENLNSFSHRVKWTEGAKGVVQIFPKQGDVWALYRNWSSDWNELTPDDVVQKYDMVEVLEDYNEEQGVPVAPLVKVAGFKSVFHQHLDTRKIYRIPSAELLRFSHQVPSYILTGQEAKKGPKGCRELDPAAMPAELLQVMAETDEGEFERTVKVGGSEITG